MITRRPAGGRRSEGARKVTFYQIYTPRGKSGKGEPMYRYEIHSRWPAKAEPHHASMRPSLAATLGGATGQI
jgi:hypothetical protein